MNHLVRLAVPSLFAVAAIAASERDAHALGPVDLEVGARVGVGTNPDSSGPNPCGIGIGGRAGVSIFHIYGGSSAIHSATPQRTRTTRCRRRAAGGS